MTISALSVFNGYDCITFSTSCCIDLISIHNAFNGCVKIRLQAI